MTCRLYGVLYEGSQRRPPVFDNVKTPQDLVKLNEEKKEQTPADSITREILDLDPSTGLQVVKNILQALIDYHEKGADMFIESNEAQKSAVWARDLGYLTTARVVIEDIELWYRN